MYSVVAMVRWWFLEGGSIGAGIDEGVVHGVVVGR